MFSNRRRDLAACLIIGCACVALRMRSMHEVTLNPDESQYEATASYLLAAGKSGFAIPYGTHATFELYRIMAALFGPYCMFEMRALVTAICVAMGCGMYLLLREVTGRWIALLSGLWLVHYNILFEGHSANREWFAAPLLMAAIWFCLRAGDARHFRSAVAWALAAGFVAEFSFWFKEQGVYFAVLLPLVFALDGLASRSWRRPLAQIAAYAIGGMMGVLAAAVILIHHGILGQIVENARTSGMAYASETSGFGETFAYASTLPVSEMFYRAYFEFLQFRTPVVLAYGCALVIPFYLFITIRRDRASRLTREQRLAAILFFNLLGAMIAVQTGRRFFGHYYLFMLVPLAGLFGIALAALSRMSTETLEGLLSRLAIGVILLVNCQVFLSIRKSGMDWRQVEQDWRRGVFLAAFLSLCALFAIGAAWAFLLLQRRRFPSRMLQRSIVGFVMLDMSLLAVAGYDMRIDPMNLRLEQLTQYLRAEARLGDKLFVWGWLPQIYSLAKLDAATQFAISQYVVQDYTNRPAPPVLSKDAVDRMFADLERFPPRFIVDASSRSIAQSRSRGAIYYLRYFPRFEQYLDSYYTRVKRVDDCTVYERR